MSIGSVIYTILIGPLELIYEFIYAAAYKTIWNPGLAIVMLSLAVNLLVLPLYKRADAIQDEERQMQKKLERGVNHIKKTFRGDERMMMLQTYYRQNNYKPTYVLRSATSLLLQIPFFIAAYNFLSGLALLDGCAFGPITDLGKPDGLLWGINALPVLMTLINMVSTIIFTKGYPRKDKIQLYVMALFFLVFLYDSPSGLVFYWTLNNLFSLVKTIFYKLKNPQKVLRLCSSVIGAGMIALAARAALRGLLKKALLYFAIGVLFQLPQIYVHLKDRISWRMTPTNEKPNGKTFAVSSLFLALLTGALIPSAVIKASPQEFVQYFVHPNTYILTALCLSIGMFGVWMGVFYWLGSSTVKKQFEYISVTACAVALLNYMAFGNNLGTMTPDLQYEYGMQYTALQKGINLLAILAVCAVLVCLLPKLYKQLTSLLLVATVALGCMSVLSLVSINKDVTRVLYGESSLFPSIYLNPKGKNVVIMMLDRGMGQYVPYIMNENAEVKRQFAGFTYYDNVISFGAFTNVGSPALYGGYEYTPLEMNKRSDTEMREKHNEALKVLPVLFRNNGFDVSVISPPYANYQWIPDVSIYDDCDIKASVPRERHHDEQEVESYTSIMSRDFFCYGFVRVLPLVFQEAGYDYGNYNHLDRKNGSKEAATQIVTDLYHADGIYLSFMNEYTVLQKLPQATIVEESAGDAFLMMANSATHEPMLLQLPSYEPSRHVDNEEYEQQHMDRYTVDGKMLKMDDYQKQAHYQVNMAAFIQLGKWFDYLRENGVYDNTRIIIVSDHGRGLQHQEDMILDDGTDIAWFYPLLMVKDFGETEYRTCHDFMTNGDVPLLAMQDVIDNPINPFTGNHMDSQAKQAHDQYILFSEDWHVSKRGESQFDPGEWFAVHGDIRDKDNWSVIARNAVFPFEN